ncbi:MAG: hypothetical protein PHG60_01150 [Candidatus Dojkabacteria bacterium]|jgi:hypothetical protein|nr:hypothetical protein [Candidatus Dojkabacteria bacterium]
MNKRNLIIILSSILVVLVLLTVFVFKARGSNQIELVTGCVPYNVSIKREGEYKGVVEWYTTDECLGYINYGNDRGSLSFIALDSENISAKQHSVVIENLLPSRNYFFVINSGDKAYGNKGVPLSFSLSSL